MLPIQKHWENPSVLHVNCEEPRSYFIPFESYNNARKGVRGTSRYYQSLNGIWNFKYYPSVYEVEGDFYAEDNALADYDSIPVPSSWQLHGYDIPNYTNTAYPYTCDHPMYRMKTQRAFTFVIFTWMKTLMKRIFICFSKVLTHVSMFGLTALKLDIAK